METEHEGFVEPDVETNRTFGLVNAQAVVVVGLAQTCPFTGGEFKSRCFLSTRTLKSMTYTLPGLFQGTVQSKA